MTTIAAVNLTTLTDLDRARYEEAALLAYAERRKWGIAISPEWHKSLVGSRSHVFTVLSGFNGVASVSNPGSDWSDTSITDSQSTVAWRTYPASVKIDQATQQGSAVELLNASLAGMAQTAGLTFDHLAATAAVAANATDTDGYCFVGQTARASIAAGDVLTLPYAMRAHARLSAAGAPPFVIPGIGQVYLAMVHPHVAYDLKSAATAPTVFSGPTYVNAGNVSLNVIGVAGGFLWVESAASALVSADAGAGNVDVYSTIFLADGALGMVSAPVADQPGCLDVALTDDRSVIGRISYPGTNLGVVKQVGTISNIGFGAIRAEGVYRVESASALGSNS